MPGDQTFTKDQSNRFVISAADLPSPGLGDESTGGIKRVGVADSTIDQFWRVRNVAVVLSAGPLVAATDDGVLRMARNISARAVR
jgi:hypothetical protein